MILSTMVVFQLCPFKWLQWVQDVLARGMQFRRTLKSEEVLLVWMRTDRRIAVVSPLP